MVATLIEQVKMLLQREQRLELIDDLQKLGISCHFLHEIAQILYSKYLNKNEVDEKDLYSTTLRFRLLRQYGFIVSQGLIPSYTIHACNNLYIYLDDETNYMTYECRCV